MDLDRGTTRGEDGWSWPPFAPLEAPGASRFSTDEWAPPSSVRRPWLRLGRFTLLYRRGS